MEELRKQQSERVQSILQQHEEKERNLVVDNERKEKELEENFRKQMQLIKKENKEKVEALKLDNERTLATMMEENERQEALMVAKHEGEEKALKKAAELEAERSGVEARRPQIPECPVSLFVLWDNLTLCVPLVLFQISRKAGFVSGVPRRDGPPHPDLPMWKRPPCLRNLQVSRILFVSALNKEIKSLRHQEWFETLHLSRMQTEYHREGNCYGESFEVCCRFEVIEATDESHTFQESPVDEDSTPHSAKDIKTDNPRY